MRGGDVVRPKPQYVDRIPNQFDGKAIELLDQTDERGALDYLVEQTGIEPVVDNRSTTSPAGNSSGSRSSPRWHGTRDFYFLDEITPYLDIGQR